MRREDEELLQMLIEKYAKLYMKIAFDNGVPYADAEDVVMEAFWAYYSSRYFQELNEAEAKRMLACIVKRRRIDFYRKNSHYEKISLESNPVESLTREERACRDPLEMILHEEKYQMVQNRIEGMKAVWREPALMYFIEGYEEPEIAEMLGISGAACRSRISRARKMLRERLDHFRD